MKPLSPVKTAWLLLVTKALVATVLIAPAALGDVPSPRRSQGRPFVMPESEREEIRELVRTHIVDDRKSA